jgi:hypothetical protein
MGGWATRSSSMNAALKRIAVPVIRFQCPQTGRFSVEPIRSGMARIVAQLRNNCVEQATEPKWRLVRVLKLDHR